MTTEQLKTELDRLRAENAKLRSALREAMFYIKAALNGK